MVVTTRCAQKLTAENNACPLTNLRQGQVQDLAPDIVKEEIDGSDVLKVFLERGALIIQGCIDLELLSEPVALLLGSSNSNDLCAIYFADLTRQRADGASSSRNHDSVTGLDIPDLYNTLFHSISNR